MLTTVLCLNIIAVLWYYYTPSPAWYGEDPPNTAYVYLLFVYFAGMQPIDYVLYSHSFGVKVELFSLKKVQRSLV